MNKRKNALNDPLSIVLALPLAQAYAHMGLRDYNEFSAMFEAAKEKNIPIPPDATTRAIATAMVLAFSAELFLKIMHFQRTGIYPQGHSLMELVEKLPNDARRSLKNRYEECVARTPKLLHLRYELFVNEPPPMPPANEHNRPPENWPGHTFEEAIALASPLFVKLRYLYEEVTVGFSANVDFSWLIFLVDALGTEVLSYQDGPMKITFNKI